MGFFTGEHVCKTFKVDLRKFTGKHVCEGCQVWSIVGMTFELHRGKCALRSLSLSYQKKDWQAGPAHPSFGMTPTREYNL